MNIIELPNGQLLSVPCGKCIPCLSQKRNDWCFRLAQEYKVSKSAYFVTLTYDNKHYPSDGSLCKKHIQDYVKRLRRRHPASRIRYFAVGEYGTKSGRAHYHIILFNATSEDNIRNSWNDSKGNPIGLVHVGNVTEASIAYCTKYVVQPDCSGVGVLRPFSIMSRGYGLGASYLTDEMVAWHREDDRNYAYVQEKKVRLPRFYREKIWPKIQCKRLKSTKEKIPLTGIQNMLNVDLIKAREALTRKSAALSKKQQQDELDYYTKKYGTRAQQVRARHQMAEIRRVKTKVKFSQKL